MTILRKLKRAVRGEIAAKTIALEVARRSSVSLRLWRERAKGDRQGKQAAHLEPRFSRLQPPELLKHFQLRTAPLFLPGFSAPAKPIAESQQRLFPAQTSELMAAAERIVSDHSWPLLGLGDHSFGTPINWHRDPLSGETWPLKYHADMKLFRGDGSDVRILWELNRLTHLNTLARAYKITNDQRFSVEFFQQVESWDSANPFGRGANWNCAMEVALRAMNLLGAFEVFRHSKNLDEQRLARLLAVFEQHGTFIRRNLEFSYVATSNHYLSDVTGLVWLGVMLPELEQAEAWRDFGLREMLSEMDKQVLDDGADFEAATGYHRFVTELFLYTFILCRANGIEIEDRYWKKLHRMLDYIRGYLRPDGRAPLIGDSDGGQVFPIGQRSGDDHAYVLAIGATVFGESRFKIHDADLPQELLWILGEQGVEEFERLKPADTPQVSRAFADAGTYILRQDDLYLLFNASGNGVAGRGSHGHNDALSIEVSACGTAFIVDPGSYVYTADLAERHLFRSTAYHSTVQVDNAEQNTTDVETPFVLGDGAHPDVLDYEFGPKLETVMAEHYGYKRLPQPVTHQRRVVFNKQQRYWFLSDRLTGAGEHDLSFRFHFATGLETTVRSDGFVEVRNPMNDARLLIAAYELNRAQVSQPELEDRFSSRDYGAKEASVSARWSPRTGLPFTLNFVIVPVRAGEDEVERLRSAMELKTENV